MGPWKDQNDDKDVLDKRKITLVSGVILYAIARAENVCILPFLFYEDIFYFIAIFPPFFLITIFPPFDFIAIFPPFYLITMFSLFYSIITFSSF